MPIFPTPVLPADIRPFPAHASGMMALRKAAREQYALTLQRADNAAMADFSFGMDGKLPEAQIDAFRAGALTPGAPEATPGIVRVIQRRDQISGVPGFLTDYVSDVSFGPKFGALTIGNHRCMWMESDCQVNNPAPTGQVYMMRANNILALGINQNAMTVMQVLQLHNSAYCNQMSGAFRGVMFCSTTVQIPNLLPGTRIYSEYDYPFSTQLQTGGGFAVEVPSDGFRLKNPNNWLDTTPFVMTYITGPNGTYIGQNESFNSVSSRTTWNLSSAGFFIGCQENSIPGSPGSLPPAVNEGMGMAELLTMAWPQEMTLAQAATIRAAIYDLVGINPLHSHSNKPLIVILTDSIWAGYKGDDLRGWDKVAMAQLPNDVRWANFAVPGSGIIVNPAAPYYGASALHWLPGWIGQAIRQHAGRVHVLWGASVNDFYDGTITPSFVYNSGYVPLINMIRSIDPAATITLVPGMRSANSSTDQHFADTSVLIRNGAAANNYNVIDLATDPIMGVRPPPGGNSTYKDGTHLGSVGINRMAQLIVPTLQSWLQSLGPY